MPSQASVRPRSRRRSPPPDTSGLERFVTDLAIDTGWSPEQVERFTSGVVTTLEERVPRSERREVDNALPSSLRERIQPDDLAPHDREMTHDEFLRRVAARTHETDRDDLEVIVRMVFRALRARLDTAEAHRIEEQLPDELRRLWNPPSFGRR